jgi:hypothetical protein
VNRFVAALHTLAAHSNYAAVILWIVMFIAGTVVPRLTTAWRGAAHGTFVIWDKGAYSAATFTGDGLRARLYGRSPKIVARFMMRR